MKYTDDNDDAGHRVAAESAVAGKGMRERHGCARKSCATPRALVRAALLAARMTFPIVATESHRSVRGHS